jgi:hypothetical protein
MVNCTHDALGNYTLHVMRDFSFEFSLHHLCEESEFINSISKIRKTWKTLMFFIKEMLHVPSQQATNMVQNFFAKYILVAIIFCQVDYNMSCLLFMCTSFFVSKVK